MKDDNTPCPSPPKPLTSPRVEKNKSTIPSPISSTKTTGIGSPRKYLTGLEGVGVWKRSTGGASVSNATPRRGMMTNDTPGMNTDCEAKTCALEGSGSRVPTPKTSLDRKEGQILTLGMDRKPEAMSTEVGSDVHTPKATPERALAKMRVRAYTPPVALTAPSPVDENASSSVLLPSTHTSSMHRVSTTTPSAQRFMSAITPVPDVGEPVVEISISSGEKNDDSIREGEVFPPKVENEVIGWAHYYMNKEKPGSDALKMIPESSARLPHSASRRGRQLDIEKGETHDGEDRMLPNSRTVVSSVINGSQSSRSSTDEGQPKQGRANKGTPSKAREAMMKDLSEMREKMRKSIGPYFSNFANSQLGALFEDLQNSSVVGKDGGLQQHAVATNIQKGSKIDQKMPSTPASRTSVSERQLQARSIQTLVRSPARLQGSNLTPTKQGRTTIPQSIRKSAFDFPTGPKEFTPRKGISSSSRRWAPTTANPSTPMSTATSQRPLSEPPTWASPQDIATFIRELNSEEKQRSAALGHSSSTPSRTAVDKKRESYTPEGTTSRPRPLNSQKPRVKFGSTSSALTPAGKSVQGRLRREDGAIRTPSKEIQDSLDRAIDERINDEKNSGRMFLPWNGKQ